MKKNHGFLFVLSGLIIILSNCNNPASNASPEEVLTAFFDKLSKRDLDGAAKLATRDSKSTLDMMKMGFEQADKMDSTRKDFTEEFKDVEIGDPKINGDMAVVPISNKKKPGESIDFPLKKEDGAWKVDFSISTMMKMAMEQRNKHAMKDDPDGHIDDIDTAEMRRGLRIADSILKNMEPEKRKEMQKALEKLKEQN
jgi:Domain of unknown function (DUF4878)